MSEKMQKIAQHASLLSYVVGFVLSIALTLAAYLLVDGKAFSRGPLLLIIAGLALAQFVAQLLFFLHMGRDAKPRFRLLLFMFAILVVVIVVGGSLWIMDNLDYHMMHSPNDVNEYLKSQDGL